MMRSRGIWIGFGCDKERGRKDEIERTYRERVC